MPGQAPNSGDSAWLAPDRQGLAGQFLRLDPALTVLATGRADNVFLCHPFLMHAARRMYLSELTAPGRPCSRRDERPETLVRSIRASAPDAAATITVADEGVLLC